MTDEKKTELWRYATPALVAELQRRGYVVLPAEQEGPLPFDGDAEAGKGTPEQLAACFCSAWPPAPTGG